MTTYYGGYVIQRIAPNHYDLWSPIGTKTPQNPSGRTFLGTFTSPTAAKNSLHGKSEKGKVAHRRYLKLEVPPK